MKEYLSSTGASPFWIFCSKATTFSPMSRRVTSAPSAGYRRLHQPRSGLGVETIIPSAYRLSASVSISLASTPFTLYSSIRRSAAPLSLNSRGGRPSASTMNLFLCILRNRFLPSGDQTTLTGTCDAESAAFEPKPGRANRTEFVRQLFGPVKTGKIQEAVE